MTRAQFYRTEPFFISSILLVRIGRAFQSIWIALEAKPMTLFETDDTDAFTEQHLQSLAYHYRVRGVV